MDDGNSHAPLDLALVLGGTLAWQESQRTVTGRLVLSVRHPVGGGGLVDETVAARVRSRVEVRELLSQTRPGPEAWRWLGRRIRRADGGFAKLVGLLAFRLQFRSEVVPGCLESTM